MLYARIRKWLVKTYYHFSFYSRLTFWLTLLSIFIWLLMACAFNFDFGIPRYGYLDDHLFVTDDIDSIRYLLSSAFQGLAALFALTISISFVVAQLASSYSPRLIIKILRRGWFIFGVSLFVLTLLYNLYLLSFLNRETVATFKSWLLLGGLLDTASILYLVPFIFLFVRAIDPWELSHSLVKKFDQQYFDEMINERRVDDTLPLFQTMLVKSIENADSDISTDMMNRFFNQLEKFIKNENYQVITVYFKSFFSKLVRKSIEKREDDVLERLVFRFEGLQNRLSSADFMKVSRFSEEYDCSLPKMILLLIEESIKSGDGEMLGRGLGSLSRLQAKIVPLMPTDDEISDIRLLKEVREGNSAYRNTRHEHDSQKIFEYIKNVFILDELVKLTEAAIKMQDKESAAYLIRHIFSSRHEFLALDASRLEVKKRVLGSLPYQMRGLLRMASESGVDVVDDVVSGVHESVSDIVKMEPEFGEDYIVLMCEAMVPLLEKRFFTTSPEFVLNLVGASGRGIIHDNSKRSAKMMAIIIKTFRDMVPIVDNKSETSLDSTYEKIRDEIATQLLSFRKWGLEKIDPAADQQLGAFLAREWTKERLEAANE